jgi:hypothetical protein
MATILLMLGILQPRDLPHGRDAAGLLLFPIAWALVIFINYREGYMYCGRNDKVYRKDEPKRFMLWLALHTLVAVIMFAVIIYSMLT